MINDLASLVSGENLSTLGKGPKDIKMKLKEESPHPQTLACFLIWGKNRWNKSYFSYQKSKEQRKPSDFKQKYKGCHSKLHHP